MNKSLIFLTLMRPKVFAFFLILNLLAGMLSGYAFQGPKDHTFNGTYRGANLQQVAFPIGGMGAGMFCLEGTGAISQISVRHHPDIFNAPIMFAALSIKSKPGSARVLEGPVPNWRKFGQAGSGGGSGGTTFGLPRFEKAEFLARYPFAEVVLHDDNIPVNVVITGWSPFIPTDENNSGLPVGALEYRFTNTGRQDIEFIFSYNARNFMALPRGEDSMGGNRILPMHNGLILTQDSAPSQPWEEGSFAIFTDTAERSTIVDHCWFRGGWWDPLSMIWKKIEEARMEGVDAVDKDAPGGSLFVPFRLKPGEERKIRVLMAWYVPDSRLRLGRPMTRPSDSTVRDASMDLPSRFYKPWYCSRFKNIGEVTDYWTDHYNELLQKSGLFRDAFFKSSLPPEVLEAVSANLSTLKSPTVLRQYDGRFWGWEGSNDVSGSSAGTCTHVWNYAQALCHLFPDMERSIRETELGEDMDSVGHQNYRAALPIRPVAHNYYLPAADGQLGGIMKIYREWRISGDDQWLRKLYPKVKTSLDYCIRTWDPRHTGTLEEPHHNTYDIELWGPDGMCTSIYLGALEAIVRIGEFLGEDVDLYRDLYNRGRTFMEHELFNGRYFFQHIRWAGLSTPDPTTDPKAFLAGDYSVEGAKMLKQEGPKYQYGNGCLSDGVLGAWLARVCGLPTPIDTQKIASHLLSVYAYNFKKDLFDYSNPQRPGFALGHEGGLLLCAWPMGGQLSLPFVYSNEVWTGVEYQVASHLIFSGRVRQGLEIVRTCRRRYDGMVRNPFDEYEAGHYYARAMSSYALLEALTGVRYDAVEKCLYVDSKVGDFTTFLSTATGFGDVIFKKGKVHLDVAYGQIPIAKTVVGVWPHQINY
jgi:uncharacterized protein (DUF608 family)